MAALASNAGKRNPGTDGWRVVVIATAIRRLFTGRTAAMAFLSPAWASEMTSCTPARPRVRSDRRKAVQNAPSSLSPTSKPRTSRCPSAATPVATTTAWETTGDRPGPCSRWRPGTRRGTAGRPGCGREGGHLDVQVRADPAHLGPGDLAISAERLDQVIDLAGRGAVQVRLHDHREQ